MVERDLATSGSREPLEKFRTAMRRLAEASGPSLKHGTRFVKVSELANQFYCEKQVDLDRTRGRSQTEDMAIGTIAHEALLKDSVRIRLERLWGEIFSGRLTIPREMLLVGTHNEISIAGSVDAVVFHRGVPTVVLEYKFTRRMQPYKDRHVQASFYCLLLHLLGFDTSHLRYAIVLAAPELKDNDEFRTESLTGVLKNIGQQRTEVFRMGEAIAIAYISDFNLHQTLDDMKWVLEYWLGKRKPLPTPDPGKCKVCEHNSTCEFSLV